MQTSELIQDIKLTIVELPEYFFRTCFVLVDNNWKKLDDFSEIGSYTSDDLLVLRLVDQPYCFREVIIHLHRFYELACVDFSYGPLHGKNGQSITTVSSLTDINNTEAILSSFLANVDPSKSPSLEELYPGILFKKSGRCLKSFRLSFFNPPTGKFKLCGHILYLEITTLEGNFYGVTATFNGFYINESSVELFDPSFANSNNFSTLDSLLSSISPLYRKNIKDVLKEIKEHHPFENIGCHLPPLPWITFPENPSEDIFRTIQLFSNSSSLEDSLFSHTREWNEELQSFQSLVVKNDQERLSKNRYQTKTVRDMIQCSNDAAIAVIDGRVNPISDNEDPRKRMYTWNNLFICIACDTKNYYRPFGGDFACHVSARLDLQSVSLLNSLELSDLHLLGTSIIDYRGHRVVAQTILPGIFTRSTQNTVDYGSIDHGKTISDNCEFKLLSETIKNKLSIIPRHAVDKAGIKHECNLSLETKGIKGTDGRLYLLDLFKVMPPDPIYIAEDIDLFKNDNPKSEPFTHPRTFALTNGFNFPSKYPHRLTFFRPELFESPDLVNYFKQNKICCSSSDSSDHKNLNIWGFPSNEQFFYHPDCFDFENCDDIDNDNMPQARNCCRLLSLYVLEKVIPSLIGDPSVFPHEYIFDHTSLTHAMHSRGVNMRYLGYVYLISTQNPLFYQIVPIIVAEMVCRSAKRIIRHHLAQTSIRLHSTLISHFLNCLLGSNQKPQPIFHTESTKTERKSSKNKNVSIDKEWMKLTPQLLWENIFNDVDRFYGFKVETSFETFLSKFKIKRLCILRAICKMVGIQILSRNYDYSSRKGLTFELDDILNIIPVVKAQNVIPKIYLIKILEVQNKLLSMGSNDIDNIQHNLEDLMSYFSQVTGPLLVESGICHELVAYLHSSTGNYTQAIQFQIKATIIFERIFGIDHFRSISGLYKLALYYTVNGDKKIATILYLRIRYLVGLCCGFENPFVHELELHIATILYDLSHYGPALSFAMRILFYLQSKPSKNIKSLAEAHQIIAAIYFNTSNFKGALEHERKALSLFKQLSSKKPDVALNSCQCLVDFYLSHALKQERVVFTIILGHSSKKSQLKVDE